MKKFVLFVMPILAISLLANCGGNKPTYTVTFDADNGTPVTKQTVKENECALEPEEKPTKEGRDKIYTFKEWQLDGNKFEFTTHITQDITLKASYTTEYKKYKVSIEEADRLSFTTMDGKPLDTISAVHGQDFKFKMEVNSSSNETIYKIPTQLSIHIGSRIIELAPENYSIDDRESPYFKATVTIFGENVVGDIRISGKAVLTDYYEINIACYGVNSDVNPELPYAETHEDKIITFTQKDGYQLPNAENIYLCFDDAESWITPADTEQRSYCEYDQANHKLTIKADKVKSNLQIKVRSPNYELLQSFSWSEINDLSINGYAQYIFYVGEEKVVRINDLDHKVRIIGFNHDTLSTSTSEKPIYAGITFEFVNVITDNEGVIKIHWNDKQGDASTNYDYPSSTFNETLTNIFDRLPPELKDSEIIKEVNKDVATKENYTVTSYKTKLFPLSHSEMTHLTHPNVKKEGEIYPFYKGDVGDKNENRIKKGVGMSKGDVYWIRSPHCQNQNQAWFIHENGRLDYIHTIYDKPYAFAPAFCI